jgi:hypothetical protein
MSEHDGSDCLAASMDATRVHLNPLHFACASFDKLRMRKIECGILEMP